MVEWHAYAGDLKSSNLSYSINFYSHNPDIVTNLLSITKLGMIAIY